MILAALALAQAGLPPTPESVTVIGVGGQPCRTWTQHRVQNEPQRSADKEWLAGFLSGAHVQLVERGVPSIFSDTEDMDALTGSVDDYCEKHPLDPVSKGAQDLWLTLLTRVNGS